MDNMEEVICNSALHCAKGDCTRGIPHLKLPECSTSYDCVEKNNVICIPVAEAQFCVVIRSGEPACSTQKRHYHLSIATKEAERLALQTGATYIVLTSVCSIRQHPIEFIWHTY